MVQILEKLMSLLSEEQRSSEILKIPNTVENRTVVDFLEKQSKLLKQQFALSKNNPNQLSFFTSYSVHPKFFWKKEMNNNEWTIRIWAVKDFLNFKK